MDEPNDAPSADLIALAGRAAKASSGGAPVDTWDPPDCGRIDIRIAADGRWYHEGRLIGREPLVRLFASILKTEAGGATYLVTPVEKLRIEVEDAPFMAVEVVRTISPQGPVLTFRTNVGDLVTADAERPVHLPADIEEDFVPYLTVRGRLRAKASRAVALELAGWLEEDGEGYFLTSGGTRFEGPRSGERER
ncbi:DUF1285 domain-containing protein [Fulvimarina endophytica]|uniref:DUF1285 domain-containing protein n=1 Tax=Fulvimarina endophytica TaxID=2293836 RepID=A0A371X8C1_9HYPH|nr:DUF1285 domain-containing protein [Fulvimarina endophytica]RFC65458.1 DUF1285 domain-containing protein [Fulvimarina endophytica]